MPVSAISGSELDWNVQAVAGHPHHQLADELLRRRGGRFKIDVLVKRDVPSVGDGDRRSVELLADCGFARQP